MQCVRELENAPIIFPFVVDIQDEVEQLHRGNLHISVRRIAGPAGIQGVEFLHEKCGQHVTRTSGAPDVNLPSGRPGRPRVRSSGSE